MFPVSQDVLTFPVVVSVLEGPLTNTPCPLEGFGVSGNACRHVFVSMSALFMARYVYLHPSTQRFLLPAVRWTLIFFLFFF